MQFNAPTEMEHLNFISENLADVNKKIDQSLAAANIPNKVYFNKFRIFIFILTANLINLSLVPRNDLALWQLAKFSQKST